MNKSQALAHFFKENLLNPFAHHHFERALVQLSEGWAIGLYEELTFVHLNIFN